MTMNSSLKRQLEELKNRLREGLLSEDDYNRQIREAHKEHLFILKYTLIFDAAIVIAGSVCFACWQKSILAGVFMLSIFIILYRIVEASRDA